MDEYHVFNLNLSSESKNKAVDVSPPTPEENVNSMTHPEFKAWFLKQNTVDVDESTREKLISFLFKHRARFGPEGISKVPGHKIELKPDVPQE